VDRPPAAAQAAALARTAVACARVAALTTYARHPSGHTTTPASVSARDDGSVEVALAWASPAVRQLLARPLATVRVSPAWCEPVVLHGSARRLPVDDAGRVRFHVQPGSVRVGPGALPVDVDLYADALPDPLRHDAPGVLAHLNGGHSEALAACLRARGHDVGFAQASGLDAGGLTVTAVGPDGVSTVRLAFARPVSRLGDLPGGLAAVLTGRCGDCRHRDRGPGATGD
jgi:hypothetical protein